MRVNNINNQYNYKNTSFGGAKDKVPAFIVNGLSNLDKKVANNSIFQKSIEFLSPKDNSLSHIIAAESVVLSSGYMICTAKSDKIDKKQKPQLIISDALTLLCSTLGAYFLDDKLKSSFDNFTEKYFAKHKDFYTELGKKELAKKGVSPINDLLKKTAETCEKKGDELKAGLDNVSEMIGEHLKNITQKKDEIKSFQITKKELIQKQEDVKNAIINSQSVENTKKIIAKNMTELYNLSAARIAADNTKPWFNKIRKFSVFACVYRFVGPDISSLLTLRADKKREQLENQAA